MQEREGHVGGGRGAMSEGAGLSRHTGSARRQVPSAVLQADRMTGRQAAGRQAGGARRWKGGLPHRQVPISRRLSQLAPHIPLPHLHIDQLDLHMLRRVAAFQCSHDSLDVEHVPAPSAPRQQRRGQSER